MCFFSIKKFFSINKKQKTVNVGDELKRSLIKNLEIFKHVPNETVCRIDDVKSTLTALLLLSVHERSSLDLQLFDQKLKSLVEYFKQDVLLREYTKRVYSKDELYRYTVVVNELFQTSELLSSQLRNMLYLNNRNSRIAEMTIEITQASKQLKEKREKLCVDVEMAIKNRMMRKWSILQLSRDNQSLEEFLSELTGMKRAMILRQQQVVGILAKVQRHVDATKMTRNRRVAECYDEFDDSATESQRYISLLQDDAADASKVINDTDGWNTLPEISSRGTFQDAL
ncbi:uncharacterized protein LOC114130857 [Aphis gossypii]|uniref:uncharacterized protein LOC114130857 n=1 Tax=Aphis gossypii TaxID=80765 RepID=UPI002158FC02|nr:uncharacterized protein LOC114130857 [Aphis gossypii]XP_050057674.1 uncharacterized protein LOC114130857 [Aphis gossypii]